MAVDDTIGIIDVAEWNPSEEELAWQEAEGLLSVSGEPDDLLYHFRCIRSGSCCRNNLCDRGEYGDDLANGCLHLAIESTLSDGTCLYKCTLPGDPKDTARQLGMGCCYPWSPERNAIIDNYRSKNNDLIAVLNLI